MAAAESAASQMDDAEDRSCEAADGNECLDGGDVPRGLQARANLVFIGPCGCGKSTTAGRFIADCDAIDADSLARIAREASAAGKENQKFAWILDKLRCERERGCTRYMGLWRLTAQGCRFTVMDAPGHDDFSKDIVTAISQGDTAVIVASAMPEDEGGRCKAQLREHALLANTLGVERLVVCINKMDSPSVGYSREVFERTRAAVREDLSEVGFASVPVVPISGLAGDCVVRRSEHMPWYRGPTLVEVLCQVVCTRMPDRPLRIPLSEVLQVGGRGVISVGRVETGFLRPGMKLLFVPGNVTAQVLSLEMHHETILEAASGDTVSFRVDVAMKDLRRGMVGSEMSCAARECSSFVAQVIVLSLPRPGVIREGCPLTISCHTSQVPCVFEELLSRMDRRTGEALEQRPALLHVGDTASVRIRPEGRMCVEPICEYPPLGRFSLRDQKTIVAIGVVTEVEYGILSPAVPRSRGSNGPLGQPAPVVGGRRLPPDTTGSSFGTDVLTKARPVEGACSSSPFSMFAAPKRRQAEDRVKGTYWKCAAPDLSLRVESSSD